MMKSICVVLALLLSAQAFAEDYEVPEEELARDSVLPVFTTRHAVLNRNILTPGHLEFAIGGANEMNEPFYNQWLGQAQLTYNFNETSAINVQALYWLPGLSSYGNQLKSWTNNTCSSGKGCNFDASLAPHPKFALIANYEFIAYYGKISISKYIVMNLNTFGIAGLGYVSEGQVGSPAFNIGVGQNFFFTRNIGIRWDLRYLMFQGVDPTSNSQSLAPGSAAPPPTSFGKTFFYNSQIDVGLVFIL